MSPDDDHPFAEVTPEEEDESGSPSACSCLYVWVAVIYIVIFGVTLLGERAAGADAVVAGVAAAASVAVMAILIAAVLGARRVSPVEEEDGEAALDLVLESDPDPPLLSASADLPDAQSLGVCPFCQSRISLRSPRVICPACRTPHHRECWQENGGCTRYGCVEARHG